MLGRQGCPYSEQAASRAAVTVLKPRDSRRENALFECVQCAYNDDQSRAVQLFMQDCGKICVTRIINTTHPTFSTVPLCFKLEGTHLTFVGGSSDMQL